MLTPLTLKDLKEGRLEEDFQEALGKCLMAWEEGLEGKCGITISIKLQAKEGSNIIFAETAVTHSTPARKGSSALYLKKARLMVESTSSDPLQPGLFERDGSPAENDENPGPPRAQNIQLGRTGN